MCFILLFFTHPKSNFAYSSFSWEALGAPVRDSVLNVPQPINCISIAGGFSFSDIALIYRLRTSASFIGLPALHLLLATHKWVCHKPTLCKGRWHFCKKMTEGLHIHFNYFKIHFPLLYNPSVNFVDSSLYTREPYHHQFSSQAGILYV